MFAAVQMKRFRSNAFAKVTSSPFPPASSPLWFKVHLKIKFLPPLLLNLKKRSKKCRKLEKAQQKADAILFAQDSARQSHCFPSRPL